MDKKINEIIRVNVRDAATAVASTSVNTVGVLVKTNDSAAVTKTYNDSTSVAEVFGENSDATVFAESFFGQDAPLKELVIVPVSDFTDEKIKEALGKAFEDNDFYHVCLMIAGDEVELNKEGVPDKASTLVVELEKFCTENKKMAHIEIDDWDKAIKLIDSLSENKIRRVSLCYHSNYKTEESEETESGETFRIDSLLAAWISTRCAMDPAKGSWAYTELTCTGDKISNGRYIEAKTKGLNVYTKVAGKTLTFFGTTFAENRFIDSTIKKDLLVFRIQENVFDLLATANNRYGVGYNDAGIQSIGAKIAAVLSTAVENEYINEEYDINVPFVKDIEKAQIEKRNLPGIEVNANILQTIQTVDPVTIIFDL